MGSKISNDRCKNCGELFIPDSRNRSHQQFCSNPDCRRASKAESQRKWLAKNPNYFTGHEHSERVQTWRKKQSGGTDAEVQRNSATGVDPREGDGFANTQFPAPSEILLQDTCALLQDLITHNPLMLGLISHLFGCVLQDHFVDAISLLLKKSAIARRRLRSLKNGPGVHRT
ncbi:MAG: hypothetical protein KJ072_20230 [Verrucomicrobia bacterium]|nr:hypothetical protein [Verrucomicrobiota bacterium]